MIIKMFQRVPRALLIRQQTRRNGELTSWGTLRCPRVTRATRKRPYGVPLVMKPTNSTIHTSNTAPLRRLAMANPFFMSSTHGVTRPSLWPTTSGTTVRSSTLTKLPFIIYKKFKESTTSAKNLNLFNDSGFCLCLFS